MNGNEDQIKFPWLKNYDVRGQELSLPEDEEKNKFPWLKDFVLAIPSEPITRPPELKPTRPPDISITRPEQLRPQPQVEQVPIQQPEDVQKAIDAMQFPLVSFRGAPREGAPLLEKPPMMASEYMGKMATTGAGGFMQAAQGLFGALDAYTDKVASLTGLPKGGLFDIASKQLDEAAGHIYKEGLPDGFLRDVISGLGGAAFDIPMIHITGLPVYMGFHGGAEGGTEGAFWGAVQGVALGKVLHGLGFLPRPARMIGGGGAFAALAEGDLQERAKQFVIGSVLSSFGRYAPKWRELKETYGAVRAVKKVEKAAEKRTQVLEQEAEKILTENGIKLEPEEAQSLGGYSRVLDEVIKAAESKVTLNVEGVGPVQFPRKDVPCWPAEVPALWHEIYKATKGKMIAPTSDTMEEWGALPRQLKRKSGMKYDEVADVMGREGQNELHNEIMDLEFRRAERRAPQEGPPEDVQAMQNEISMAQEKILIATGKTPAEIDEFARRGEALGKEFLGTRESITDLAGEVVNGERTMGSAVEMAKNMIEDIIGKPPEAEVFRGRGEIKAPDWREEIAKERSPEDLKDIKRVLNEQLEGLNLVLEKETNTIARNEVTQRIAGIENQIGIIDKALGERAKAPKALSRTRRMPGSQQCLQNTRGAMSSIPHRSKRQHAASMLLHRSPTLRLFLRSPSPVLPNTRVHCGCRTVRDMVAASRIQYRA